jgi:hypothetical protein
MELVPQFPICFRDKTEPELRLIDAPKLSDTR